jgi:hypothetical protein
MRWLVLLSAVLLHAVLHPAVDPANRTHQINPLFMGCHSDSGYTHQPRGFYSQMVFGESFEVPPPGRRRRQLGATGAAASQPAAPPSGDEVAAGGVALGTYVIRSLSGQGLRHCDFQLWSCPADPMKIANDGDFIFNMVSALDGAAAGAVSLQSSNFPSVYIQTGLPLRTNSSKSGLPLEPGRLGLAMVPKPNASKAVWKVVSPGLSGAAGSISSQQGTDYITTVRSSTGICAPPHLPQGCVDVVTGPISTAKCIHGHGCRHVRA